MSRPFSKKISDFFERLRASARPVSAYRRPLADSLRNITDSYPFVNTLFEKIFGFFSRLLKRVRSAPQTRTAFVSLKHLVIPDKPRNLRQQVFPFLSGLSVFPESVGCFDASRVGSSDEMSNATRTINFVPSPGGMTILMVPFIDFCPFATLLQKDKSQDSSKWSICDLSSKVPDKLRSALISIRIIMRSRSVQIRNPSPKRRFPPRSFPLSSQCPRPFQSARRL